jgi:hypothetical protein
VAGAVGLYAEQMTAGIKFMKRRPDLNIKKNERIKYTTNYGIHRKFQV